MSGQPNDSITLIAYGHLNSEDQEVEEIPNKSAGNTLSRCLCWHPPEEETRRLFYGSSWAVVG